MTEKRIKKHLFCEKCTALLVKNTTSDSFTFRCEPCGNEYKANELDSKIYDRSTLVTQEHFKTVLANATEDPTNLNIKIECDCGSDIGIQLRAPDMRAVIVCKECRKVYTDTSKKRV
jgi:DNA-directed RNA polymerase subunit M/transcription elongation factor TFIIS